MRVAEQNRSRGTPARIRAQIREHVEWLNRQIDELDHEIGQRVRSSPAWRERDDLYRSTPGVGPVLSATLLADLPELGSVSHKQIAALVGFGSTQSRQWQEARTTRDLGRPSDCTSCAVHGHTGSHQAQSGDPGLLPTPSRHAQTQEGGAHRVHAQTPHDPQRHDPTSDSVVCTCAGERMIFKLELAAALDNPDSC